MSTMTVPLFTDADLADLSGGSATGRISIPPELDLILKQQTNITYGFMSSGIVMFLFACLFKAKVVDTYPLHLLDEIIEDGGQPQEAWDSLGLFSVVLRPATCCYVMCCSPVLTAKNYHVTEICDFWPACCLLYVTYNMCCVGICVRTYFSSQLKTKLHIQHNLFCDFLLNLLCMPCELGRESLVVDEVMGLTIGCPMRVVHTETDKELEPY